MKQAKQIGAITSFKVMDILERAKQLEAEGKNIIHFEIGEPEFPTPKPVADAGIKAIRDGFTKYTHSLGIEKLRQAICHYYGKEYNVDVNPARVMVCNGSSAGLFLSFASILNKGNEVIIGTPHYSCYPNYVRFLGGKPLLVKLREGNGWRIDPKDVKKKLNRNVSAILLNSPGNPTGAVLPKQTLAEIASMGKMIISDEIYMGLSYGVKERSVLEFTDSAFAVSGFSKKFAMTGWRIGWVVAPEKLLRPMQKLQQSFQISPNSMAQMAGLAALKRGGKAAAAMKKEFALRRRLMIDGLRKIGFQVPVEPEGAFYVMVSSKFLGKSSYNIAIDILEKASVAVTPGVDFGKAGEGYLRFSYTTTAKKIKDGLMRIDEYLRAAKSKSNR